MEVELARLDLPQVDEQIGLDETLSSDELEESAKQISIGPAFSSMEPHCRFGPGMKQVRKASWPPPLMAWSGFSVGKSSELVSPTTQTVARPMACVSMIWSPQSKPMPPR